MNSAAAHWRKQCANPKIGPFQERVQRRNRGMRGCPHGNSGHSAVRQETERAGQVATGLVPARLQATLDPEGMNSARRQVGGESRNDPVERTGSEDDPRRVAAGGRPDRSSHGSVGCPQPQVHGAVSSMSDFHAAHRRTAPCACRVSLQGNAPNKDLVLRIYDRAHARSTGSDVLEVRRVPISGAWNSTPLSELESFLNPAGDSMYTMWP